MIILILLLSLILRLINLNQSLWLDEAVQAITSKGPFLGIFAELQGDFHPPLYHLLMWGWAHLFGNGEIAMRLPSVFFGTATIYIVYLIAKLFTSEESLRATVRGVFSFTSEVSPRRRRVPSTSEVFLPPLAALFLATAPFHIYYSQEARMYSLTCFLAVLSMFYFLKIFSEGIPGQRPTSSKFKMPASTQRGEQSSKLKFIIQNFNLNFLWYFLATILMLYSDYYGFFVLLAQGIYLLIKRKYKFIIINSIFIILFYLPWFPMLLTQLKTGSLAIQSLPEWGKLVNLSFVKALPLTFIKFSIGRITIFNKMAYGSIAVVLGIFYGYLFFKGIKGWLKDGKGNLIVVLLWLLIPLGFAWIASLFVPNYQPFRLLLILPAFYLLLAGGVVLARTSMIYIIEVVVLLLVNLISVGVYYFNPFFHREDWRGVAAYLSKKPDTVVILPSEISNWPIRYYDPDDKINLVSVGKGVNIVDDGQLSAVSGWLKAGSNKKVYYVRYLVPLFDPEEKILKEIERSNYSKIKEISFNQIPVWEYARTEVR